MYSREVSTVSKKTITKDLVYDDKNLTLHDAGIDFAFKLHRYEESRVDPNYVTIVA